MKIPFFEEFEATINGEMFQVEASGDREWDEDGRVFTTLSKLVIIDELGNELNDTSDVFNEIHENIVYSRDLDEDSSFDDEEEIPNWLEG